MKLKNKIVYHVFPNSDNTTGIIDFLYKKGKVDLKGSSTSSGNVEENVLA